LAPRGDTPSTQRLYDAAESCSIPVLISDSVFAEGTPFQCLVPVKEMSLTVSEQKIMRNAGGALQELMDIVGKERRNAMRYFLKHFAKDLLWHDESSRVAENVLLEAVRWSKNDGKMGDGRECEFVDLQQHSALFSKEGTHR